MVEATACQDYAGAFGLGVIEAGFHIAVKVENTDGFGISAYKANEYHLGTPQLYAAPPRDWPVWKNTEFVFGNPPCSGFSSLVSMEKYVQGGTSGVDARQNQCMWDLVGYAARHPNIRVIAFESVSAAGRTGLPLMRNLWRTVEKETRKKWNLTHVFMNHQSVHGWQNRARYFCCMTLGGVPTFPAADGWERPLWDAIGDLAGRVEPEGRFSVSKAPRALRLAQLAAADWNEGEPADVAYARAVEKGLMEPWLGPGRTDIIRCPYTSWRWSASQPAKVITGGVFEEAVHPREPRCFTHAEVARLTGYPDDFDLTPFINDGVRGKSMYGKQLCVQAGSWFAEGVMTMFEDGLRYTVVPQPAELEREFKVDVTNAFKVNRPPQDQLVLDGMPPAVKKTKKRRDIFRR